VRGLLPGDVVVLVVAVVLVEVVIQFPSWQVARRAVKWQGWVSEPWLLFEPGISRDAPN